MKALFSILLFALAFGLHGQMLIDGPVLFTGPADQRGVDGLAPPTTSDAAISVQASLVGTTTWAVATANGMDLELQPNAPLDAHRDGQLLRFVAPSPIFGQSSLACTGLPPAPLVRPDGLEPVRGQIRTGMIIEVVRSGERWILMNAPERDCPPGTVAINDRICIEQAIGPETYFYDAVERCDNRGGRLCDWNEFYLACMEQGSQLTGLLTAWEWVDDSSNHSHSAVQVGSGACTAQRSAHPQVLNLGRSRCCYQTR